jgi:ribokinase
MRAAVVGHVEWVDFARVERLPEPGEIVTALETWAEAAGGGAMAARELLRLGAETTFFTVVGGDDFGGWAERTLRATGLRLELATRDAPQRRCFTFLDSDGERTITALGAKLVPHADEPFGWDELEQTDVVYFCGGDAGALRHARRARTLVATARELPTLAEAGVRLDALVHSARDPSERYQPGDLDPAPVLVATTEGSAGGRYLAAGQEGRWEAAPLPGPLVDVYGAGDCFAAGLAYGLGEGRTAADALAFAARAAAHAMTRPGGGSAA